MRIFKAAVACVLIILLFLSACSSGTTPISTPTHTPTKTVEAPPASTTTPAVPKTSTTTTQETPTVSIPSDLLDEIVSKWHVEPDLVAETYKLEPDWDWTLENKALRTFFEFIREHPDSLELRYDDIYVHKYVSDISTSDHKELSSGNVRDLWYRFITHYGKDKIEPYYLFFKAAVDIYSDQFISTTGYPDIKNSEMYYVIDDEEMMELERLLDNYIQWNEKKELYVDLITLDPLNELAINQESIYEYLRVLVSPHGYHKDLPDVQEMFEDEVYKQPGYYHFLLVRFWTNMLELRHDEIWREMHNQENLDEKEWVQAGECNLERSPEEIKEILESAEGKFEAITIDECNYIRRYKNVRQEALEKIDWLTTRYDCTQWDKDIFTLQYLSHYLYPQENCGFIEVEGHINASSVGFACGSTTYDQIEYTRHHASQAIWISKRLLASFDEYGGALNVMNWIPKGIGIIERWTKDGADDSKWINIEIRFMTGLAKVVYETEMPYFDLWTEPSYITLKSGETGYITCNVTIKSYHGFDQPVLLSLDTTRKDSDYPEDIFKGCVYSFEPDSVTPNANGEVISCLTVSGIDTSFPGGYYLVVIGECDEMVYRNRVERYIRIYIE